MNKPEVYPLFVESKQMERYNKNALSSTEMESSSKLSLPIKVQKSAGLFLFM